MMYRLWEAWIAGDSGHVSLMLAIKRTRANEYVFHPILRILLRYI
jgi:hypothetical protein